MADEPKPPKEVQPSASGEMPAKPPTAEGAGAVSPPAGPAKPTESAPPKPAPVGAAAESKPAEPAKSAAPTKPAEAAQPAAGAPEGAAGPPKPAAPAKPTATAPPKPPPKAPVKPEPWTSPLLDELKKRFPGAIAEAVVFRNQPAVTVGKESLITVCEFLKSDDGGAYTLLTDETAVDYPKREKRFEVIYQLYSFKRNDRLRLKVLVSDKERIPSVVGIWPTANWLEREVFDMFGVLYEGHPDLKRILLPDGWVGHPLRKDYDILRQDEAWVKTNLHIESGQ